jgi:hypothetical protein
MTEPTPPLPRSATGWGTALVAAGLVYLGLGLLLLGAFVMGGVQSSLFPTGWLFPAVLTLSGALMAARRRFDIVVTLWAALALVVFMLGVLVYVNALDRGLDDAAAFDAAIIVAGCGLLALVLRPGFRS